MSTPSFNSSEIAQRKALQEKLDADKEKFFQRGGKILPPDKVGEHVTMRKAISRQVANETGEDAD